MSSCMSWVMTQGWSCWLLSYCSGSVGDQPVSHKARRTTYRSRGRQATLIDKKHWAADGPRPASLAEVQPRQQLRTTRNCVCALRACFWEEHKAVRYNGLFWMRTCLGWVLVSVVLQQQARVEQQAIVIKPASPIRGPTIGETEKCRKVVHIQIWSQASRSGPSREPFPGVASGCNGFTISCSRICVGRQVGALNG